MEVCLDGHRNHGWHLCSFLFSGWNKRGACPERKETSRPGPPEGPIGLLSCCVWWIAGYGFCMPRPKSSFCRGRRRRSCECKAVWQQRQLFIPRTSRRWKKHNVEQGETVPYLDFHWAPCWMNERCWSGRSVNDMSLPQIALTLLTCKPKIDKRRN